VQSADASEAGRIDTRRMTDSDFELVLAAKQDHDRRGELIDAFGPLIASMARGYRRPGIIDHPELMQQGVVGLLNALERYDPTLGAPFWAYASWWVRQAMQQTVSQLTRPVVLSDRAQRQLARVSAARRAHVQKHRTEPTPTELAAAAGLDPRHLDSLTVAATCPRSLQEPIGYSDDSACLGDLLADPHAEDEFECVPQRMVAKQVTALLAHLNERERFVVSGRFGLDGHERTLRDIAADLGVSAERVRQIEQHALETLRAVVHAAPGLGTRQLDGRFDGAQAGGPVSQPRAA
jgi:RNA polymerase sigma factor (sigma-70 family)